MSGSKFDSPVIADLKAKMKRGKVVSAEDAVRLIAVGDTVAFEGFGGCAFAEEIAGKIEEAFLKTGQPRDLTVFYCAGQGDFKTRGQQHLAHEGLMKKVIAGHFGVAPGIGKLVSDNKIQAYNLPQGVLAQLTRDIASHRPRLITHVGLGTFVDPRKGGGKLNASTTEDIVELAEYDGREYLAYKTFPINVAVIRGTTADLDGNITMEKESLILTNLSMAMAAKNSGGFVIAQVERIADRGALRAKDVKVPGIMVDCVVVAEPENHHQTFASPLYNPAFSGEFRVPMQSIPPLPLDERKVIARRAALELRMNSVVNLGFGMPEGVASVANEEGILDYLTLTTESGTIGGVPAAFLSFGSSSNPEAIIDMAAQFDYYDGGGLDVAFLGLAEVDKEGNLNVSKFGPKLAGAGGFINISQTTKKLVFVGTFTAGDTRYEIGNGNLKIVQEGSVRKFINDVEQITFSGATAVKNDLPVLYITERCVFELTAEGLELTEIAPGVDLEKDILGLMDFKPIIKKQPVPMDERIFLDGIVGLREELLSLPLEDRITYSEEENILFVNFEGLSVRTHDDIRKLQGKVEEICKSLKKKVFAIVNYDNFSIVPELEDAYISGVKQTVDRYYQGVARYTTSAFVRFKLGDALKQKGGLKPSIYKNQREARAALDI